ncbi:MAG: alpha-amylase family glycosyl hydrolase [Erysipelotrichia bacterium]|nr:alpha-amylase family glycosyl hydrolase [Erysipelotrichia bacterium]
MQEYMLYPYLDNYHTVTVEMSERFFPNQEKTFHLFKEKELIPLKIEKIATKRDKIIYTLTFEPEITIGDDYYLMTYNNYCVPLIYRYIVKTDRFNQEFYYGSDDLGAVVKNGVTSFKVWAPTAKNLWLNIEDRMYKMIKGDGGVFHLSFDGNLNGTAYNYLAEVNGRTFKTIDPYGKGQTPNSKKSVVVDYSQDDFTVRDKSDSIVIYEVSVRDYSREGTFKAMSENLAYLRDLSFTHLQLLPVNDFASVNDYFPAMYYNWGYDPVSYQALQSSYFSDIQNPLLGIAEFKQLVKSIHQNGMKVVLDVVFNHHYNAAMSSFNCLVPYYYFRYDEDGNFGEKTFCGAEFDSRQLMCQKFFTDTLVYFVKFYDIDGFRFDLMSFLDVKTMQEIARVLKNIRQDILLYGEGWMMETSDKEVPMANMAHKKQLPDYFFFDDGFRDCFKGNTFIKEAQGYISGNVDLAPKALEYFIKPANQRINYVQCHDDMTCFDKLKCCCPNEEEKLLVARQKLLIGCVLMSRGLGFLGAGQEFCISKKGLESCYNVSDEINNLSNYDKDKYRDVIDYTAQLIELKKHYHIGDVDCTGYVQDNLLFVNIDYLTIIVNPYINDYNYTFAGQKRVVFDGQKKTNGIIEKEYAVKGLSLVILQEI